MVLHRWIAIIWVVLSRAYGAGIARWDFDGNLTSSTGAAALVAGFTSLATSPGPKFSTTKFAGKLEQIASFTRGTYLRATHGLGASGGGKQLNQFTVILDLNPANRPEAWAAAATQVTSTKAVELIRRASHIEPLKHFPLSAEHRNAYYYQLCLQLILFSLMLNSLHK